MKKGKRKKGKRKRGITHVEIIFAFAIFILGISTILYFFIPFFRPTYYASLDTLEKKFEKDFFIEAELIRLVVNQTGEIKFKAYNGITETNSIIFNKNFIPVDFYINDNYIVMNTDEKELFVLKANAEINSKSNLYIDNPTEVNVYYSFPINEIFVNLSKFQEAYDYESLKRNLGMVSDFNITLANDVVYTIGKPIPRVNVFAREKVYKIIEDKKIKYVTARFYVW